MRLHLYSFSWTLLLCSLASYASAQAVDYDISVNTASIAGTSGSLDFNFNPGSLVSQAASVEIFDLSSNGTLIGSPSLTGDASGSLASAIKFDNATAFNDYFQGFKFGTSLSFEVALSGPALSNPGGATSGSAFAFSMFSDSGGTNPTLTSNAASGYAVVANVNLNGTTTLTNYSPETSISGGSRQAPEIDSGSWSCALVLLVGSLCVLRGYKLPSA